jgi:dolichol-phosphate mannosyltransferase
MSSSAPKAIIIIPTYNESKGITVTLEAVLAVFEKIHRWNMGILVVDDTSPDKTYEVVEKLQKKYPQLHLLLNPTKAGLGGAYLKGMAYAFGELKADVVFEFDADLSHDPTKIPSLLAKIEEGYDLVLGSRYIPGGGIPEDWGAHRKFLSIVGNFVARLILGNLTIKDWTGGYRAITRRVYEKVLPELNSKRFSGYTFQIGFLHKAVNAGFTVAEVPYYFKDRTIGLSKIGPEYIKNTLIYILKVRSQEIMSSRLFKFVVVGGGTAALQLVMLSVFRAILQPWQQAVWFWFVTPYLVATILAIELAVATNFFLSNLWTFADRKLEASETGKKFLQFNAASAGSITIQFFLSLVTERLFGLRPLFVVPIIHKLIDSGTVFAVVGILIGMFWNFFAYTRIVWRKK